MKAYFSSFPFSFVCFHGELPIIYKRKKLFSKLEKHIHEFPLVSKIAIGRIQTSTFQGMAT